MGGLCALARPFPCHQPPLHDPRTDPAAQPLPTQPLLRVNWSSSNPIKQVQQGMHQTLCSSCNPQPEGESNLSTALNLA